MCIVTDTQLLVGNKVVPLIFIYYYFLNIFLGYGNKVIIRYIIEITKSKGHISLEFVDILFHYWCLC